MDMLNSLKQKKIVAIIRNKPTQELKYTVEALLKGGIYFLELALNNASEETIENSISQIFMVNEEFGSNIALGAGTILTQDAVNLAKDAGASYMISPNTDEEVIKYTKQQGLLSFPGAMTPTEVASAKNWGADVVKLFPAGNLGVVYMKALMAPLRHIPMMAVGGVDLSNMRQFLEIGAIGLGIGSCLTDFTPVAGDYKPLVERARAYVSATK